LSKQWGPLQGWLFIGVFLGTLVVVALYLWRVNPEVVVARSGFHEVTKRWDNILLSFYFPAVYAIVPVAALDDGRFHWLPMPWWVCGVGYVLFLVGMGIVTWAEAVNEVRR
jgi:protein-S-isoprenylcysteine O-methyltransferase Ste14